jgi:hypothetical protein
MKSRIAMRTLAELRELSFSRSCPGRTTPGYYVMSFSKACAALTCISIENRHPPDRRPAYRRSGPCRRSSAIRISGLRGRRLDARSPRSASEHRSPARISSLHRLANTNLNMNHPEWVDLSRLFSCLGMWPPAIRIRYDRSHFLPIRHHGNIAIGKMIINTMRLYSWSDETIITRSFDCRDEFPEHIGVSLFLQETSLHS